jgi:sodium/proline symporter
VVCAFLEAFLLERRVRGMVDGGGMVFVWKYLVRPLGGAWNIYELLPAFITACVAIIAVSLLTKAPDKEEITDGFDSVVRKDTFHEVSV